MIRPVCPCGPCRPCPTPVGSTPCGSCNQNPAPAGNSARGVFANTPSASLANASGGNPVPVGNTGRLPVLNGYPLAMAYVPEQRFEGLYSPEEGLAKGTVFEALDLPFLGETIAGYARAATEPLSGADSYAYPFAAWDIRLYLDTHPDDTEALEAYRSLCEASSGSGFACMGSALTENASSDSAGWTWVSSPWPWEPEANVLPCPCSPGQTDTGAGRQNCGCNGSCGIVPGSNTRSRI